jgi:hypothetical protein
MVTARSNRRQDDEYCVQAQHSCQYSKAHRGTQYPGAFVTGEGLPP